jgi:adenosylmethionine-8-amino-7-oxononanoate aminotransferase
MMQSQYTSWHRRLVRTAKHVGALDAPGSSAVSANEVEVLAPVRLGGPRVSHGIGIYVFDQDGNKYIDGSGGPAGVFSLGHAHPEVTKAAKDQMDQIAFGYTKYFSSDPAAELTKMIGELAGGGLNNVVYCGGGSEAVESCLKIALQCQAARGYPNRARFVSGTPPRPLS